MNASTEAILDKVRKLLALARGTPYAGEAENAMAAVQRLLLEHGLSLSDAHAAGDDGFLYEAVWRGSRPPDESLFVWNLVEGYFNVFPIRDGNCLMLLGRPENVAVAKYVGVYLSRTFRALWSAYRSTRRAGRSQQRAYYHGLQLGVAERLWRERRDMTESRPELGALVRSQAADLEAEKQRRFGGQMRDGKEISINFDGTAFEDGYKRGGKIGIRTPLPAPAGSGGEPRRLELQ